MSVADTHRAVLAVWRIEQPRLIAGLARMTRDVALAEELAQDALVSALEHWPGDGVPERPGAWLMATAKRRAIDHLRRNRMLAQKHATLARELDDEQTQMPDFDGALDDDIGEDTLRLIFTACHPLLTAEARAALTLRMIGGLTTGEIARAFLATEVAIAQRIGRAKRTLSDAGVAYETPRGAELAQRLPTVLAVLYLIFNEGYAATAGDDWMRPQLCDEATRLGRVLAALMPQEAEVHGLLALMELHASRTAARTGPDGEPVLLLEQDRARWDRLMITHGLAALARAEQLAPERGPYTLQAAIVACHARAATAAATDWARIASLYGELAAIAPSPVVELNRAVAVGMAEGPAAGLAIVDRIAGEPTMKTYHLLASVRGDLLSRLGRHAEARLAFDAAAQLATNRREQELMQRRAREAATSAAG